MKRAPEHVSMQVRQYNHPVRCSTFFSLVAALIRNHRFSYRVMCMSTFKASLLCAGTAQVSWSAFKHQGERPVSQMSTYDRLLSDTGYEMAGDVALVAYVCCPMISIFLVLSSVSFLAQERYQEFGRMRLSGARVATLERIELCEFSMPLALANVAGGLAGSLLTAILGHWFAVAADLPSMGLKLNATIHPLVTVAVFLAMIFLLQSVFMSISGRDEQNRRLYQIGVLRQAITESIVIEITLDLLLGSFIAFAAMAVVILGLASAFRNNGISMWMTPLPIGMFLLLSAVLLILVILAAVVCSRMFLRHDVTSSVRSVPVRVQGVSQ